MKRRASPYVSAPKRQRGVQALRENFENNVSHRVAAHQAQPRLPMSPIMHQRCMRFSVSSSLPSTPDLYPTSPFFSGKRKARNIATLGARSTDAQHDGPALPAPKQVSSGSAQAHAMQVTVPSETTINVVCPVTSEPVPNGGENPPLQQARTSSEAELAAVFLSRGTAAGQTPETNERETDVEQPPAPPGAMLAVKPGTTAEQTPPTVIGERRTDVEQQASALEGDEAMATAEAGLTGEAGVIGAARHNVVRAPASAAAAAAAAAAATVAVPTVLALNSSTAVMRAHELLEKGVLTREQFARMAKNDEFYRTLAGTVDVPLSSRISVCSKVDGRLVVVQCTRSMTWGVVTSQILTVLEEEEEESCAQCKVLRSISMDGDELDLGEELASCDKIHASAQFAEVELRWR